MINTWRNGLTLSQQLTLVFGALCLVLVLAASYIAATIAQEQAARRTEAAMESLAVRMASRLEMYLGERVRDIESFAHLPALSEAWASEDPDRIRAVLESLQDDLEDYAWIGFASPGGTVLAATDGLLENASVAERPWFTNGGAGTVVEDVHDAKMLADLLGPSIGGEPFRFVDIASPVQGDSGLTGILVAHLSWTLSRAVRDSVLATVSPDTRTSIIVLREDGRVILGPGYDSSPFPASLVEAIHAKGQATLVESDAGGDVLMSAVRMRPVGDHDLGWIVVAQRPLSVALAGAWQLAGTILAVGLFLAVLGVAASWRLSARLLRPLRRLTAEVDLIGRDPAINTIRRQIGSRDLLMLSGAIRSLLRRIGTEHAARTDAEMAAETLQRRMDERTRQLGDHISSLQVLADTDPLTRLLNRRAFRVFADDAMAYYRRYQRGVGVMVVDIDHFKQVNDRFGHGAGDEVIQAVATIIQNEVRTTDKVARFGGEEFIVLLRETEPEGAERLAERIRALVAETPIDARGMAGIMVTVSIGVTLAVSEDRDFDDVIDRADRALYTAKAGGRNAVAMEPPVGIESAAA